MTLAWLFKKWIRLHTGQISVYKVFRSVSAMRWYGSVLQSTEYKPLYFFPSLGFPFFNILPFKAKNVSVLLTDDCLCFSRAFLIAFIYREIRVYQVRYQFCTQWSTPCTARGTPWNSWWGCAAKLFKSWQGILYTTPSSPAISEARDKPNINSHGGTNIPTQ